MQDIPVLPHMKALYSSFGETECATTLAQVGRLKGIVMAVFGSQENGVAKFIAEQEKVEKETYSHDWFLLDTPANIQKNLIDGAPPECDYDCIEVPDEGSNPKFPMVRLMQISQY